MTDMSEPAPVPDRPMTASQRLAREMGRDVPPELTEDQLREFELAQDKADHDAGLIYGAQGEEAA
jgi:hypothetical protein